MKIYEVIGCALTKLYESIPGSPTDREGAVWAAINRLDDQFRRLHEGIAIDYSDNATQFAYLFKYAGIRASAISSRQQIAALNLLYANENLRISCFGGGPGSDVLGILQHWERIDSETILQIDLADVDASWETTARLVWECASLHLDMRRHPALAFRRFDASDANVATTLQAFTNAQYFTVSYLLSELPNYAVAFRFVDAMMSNAQTGSVFLLIDNDTDQIWNNNTEGISKLLTNISGRGDLETKVYEQKTIYLDDEDVGDMGDHFDRFGSFEKNGHPNVTLNATYLIAVKK